MPDPNRGADGDPDAGGDADAGAAYPDDVAALARELVRVPSENPPGEERAVAAYVVGWARAHGLDAERLDTPGYPERPNAVVAVGDVETASTTVVLNGHTDVVPAGNADAWTHDPYEGVVATAADGDGGEREVLYGRGSADMKAGLSLALVTANAFAERVDAGDGAGSDAAEGALVVHAAAGEETGIPGTRACIEAGYGGDCAVVLEPTDLRVATSAKGVVTYRVTVRGESTHASHPDEGANAIDAARALFDRVDAYDAELREREDDLVGRGYASVTSVEAGTDGNMGVIPGRLTFLLDRRVLPGESIEDVDAEVDALLDAAAREADVDAGRETVQYYESASIPADHPLAELVRDETGDRAPGEPWGMTAATDAREFAAAGIPAVVWGPGSLSQAHTVDERVPLEEVRDARGVLEAVVERALDGALDD
ncbi:M20/M25/M40 family metallo-hydrolase [Halorubellus sp. PRR65]|uniref:M20 family metallopeptidase n=1 Tax=Halorubellus sp. PRR65 TaxID=3098148 RepID=UPI002B2588FE|nr:M20/M25/M40 family metallo-hydrolase [Halorubellus sp. PRR65]